MPLDAPLLKKILLAGQYLGDDDLKKAELASTRTGRSLTESLYLENVVSEDLVRQAIAEYFNIQSVDLSNAPLARESLTRIPEDVMQSYRVVFLEEKGTTVHIATDDPSNKTVAAELGKIFPKKKIVFVYVSSEDLDETLTNVRRHLGGTFLKMIEEKIPAPEVLTSILNDALSYHASDIHIEPQEQAVTVRFRIDGILQDIGTFPKESHEAILNCIKVQAHIRTDEHFSAQDGSLRHAKDGAHINVRVSIIPTLDGEKVAMRILAEYIRGLTLPDLGLSEKHQLLLTQATQKPCGMVLVVGPTGSGKTTTLYGLLKSLNKSAINITTIEDPVEYKIPGVNHIQVNVATRLTFANGLRSIVRQDPDVIFLGEIRDNESAEIAINAALTGHLLLSTFHSNDAPTAIPRLLDMGIERFLLSSTLELIVAQTLVRRLCEHCRYSYTGSLPGVKTKKITLYKSKGCATCVHTGYKGRVALYECIRNTPLLQELILTRPSSKEVWACAKKQGALSLYDDGIEKVRAGITSLEEVTRVTTPPNEKYS